MARSNGGALRSRVTATLQQLRRAASSGGACCFFRALQRYTALPFASKLPAARVAFFAPCSGMQHCHTPASFRRRVLLFSCPAAVCGFAIRQQASGGACCVLCALQRYAALPFASKLPAAHVAFFAPCSGMRLCHSPASFRRRMLPIARPRRKRKGGDKAVWLSTRQFQLPSAGVSQLMGSTEVAK